MSQTIFSRLSVGIASCLVATTLVALVDGQEGREGLNRPVLRISKARVENQRRAPAHPLDAGLDLANRMLQRIQTGVVDYECTLVKQEKIGDTVRAPEYMFARVRNRKMQNGVIAQPFSVYLWFKEPKEIRGREVVYIENQNEGNLRAKEARGFASFVGWVSLPPTGKLAMRDQRYPITEIGLENLVEKLIERGMQDKQRDPAAQNTQVQFIKGAKINGRTCTVLQLTHPIQSPQFEFYIARVFIDDELQVPVRYAAYEWPTMPGGEPGVIESYTYTDLRLNVGLQDQDFDTKRAR